MSLNGIIYVLGISHDRVVELINKKYQTNTGEQYLKKFIQIPLLLTEWNGSEIVELIDYLLKNDIIHDDYKPIIEENKDIIASAIEVNPREIKRFLNNLIISYEVFVNIQDLKGEKEKELFLKQLLLVQILNSNWRDRHRQIVNSNGTFLCKLESFIPFNIDEIERKIGSGEGITDSEVKAFLERYKSDTRLSTFLNRNNFDILAKINDWTVFRTCFESYRKQIRNHSWATNQPETTRAIKGSHI